MDIQILEFIPNAKNFRVGNVDFKVTHTSEKSETFRNAAYFEKDGKKWISLPMVERNGKWYPNYERTPGLKDMLNEVTKALVKYLETTPQVAMLQSAMNFDRK